MPQVWVVKRDDGARFHCQLDSTEPTLQIMLRRRVLIHVSMNTGSWLLLLLCCSYSSNLWLIFMLARIADSAGRLVSLFGPEPNHISEYTVGLFRKTPRHDCRPLVNCRNQVDKS